MGEGKLYVTLPLWPTVGRSSVHRQLVLTPPPHLLLCCCPRRLSSGPCFFPLLIYMQVIGD